MSDFRNFFLTGKNKMNIFQTLSIFCSCFKVHVVIFSNFFSHKSLIFHILFLLCHKRMKASTEKFFCFMFIWCKVKKYNIESDLVVAKWRRRFLKFNVFLLGFAAFANERSFKSDWKNSRIRKMCVISNETSDIICKNSYLYVKKFMSRDFLVMCGMRVCQILWKESELFLFEITPSIFFITFIGSCVKLWLWRVHFCIVEVNYINLINPS